MCICVFVFASTARGHVALFFTIVCMHSLPTLGEFHTCNVAPPVLVAMFVLWACPGFTGRPCCGSSISNFSEVMQMIQSNTMSASFIDASLLTSLFHLQVAMHKATENYKANRMVTKDIHPELVFSLSPARNISEGLRTFSANPESPAILVGVYTEHQDVVDKTLSVIQGHQTEDLREIQKYSHESRLREIYKILDSELQTGSLEDIVVSKVAISGISNP
jgi:EKC/KEOPS complex subunit CGI121/TPRKB